MFLQAFLLVGDRKRFWIWLVLVVVGSPINAAVGSSAYHLYHDFFSLVLLALPTLPLVLVPSFVLTHLMTLTVIVGAVTAFLMPPVDPNKSSGSVN
jgi:hypothetical protein